MSQSQPTTSPPAKPPAGPVARYWRAGWLVAVLSAVCIALLAEQFYCYYPSRMGPEQPIAFSHRLHFTDKTVNCLFCHSGALDTKHAGIPPLETCMTCHRQIITDHPQIENLRRHYEAGQPVAWERVNDLPDYVFFDHSAHLAAGKDCSQCHGDVAGMDRVYYYERFQMGFCVQCHRDNNASHDCLTCHR
jgi:hypothetical protein